MAWLGTRSRAQTVEQKAFPVVHARRVPHQEASAPPFGIPQQWSGDLAGTVAPQSACGWYSKDRSGKQAHQSAPQLPEGGWIHSPQAAFSNGCNQAKVTGVWVKSQTCSMDHLLCLGRPLGCPGVGNHGMRTDSSSGRASLVHRPGNSWAAPIFPPSFA